MKLLVWAPRSNHLKILGPVAAEAHRRGHDLLIVAPAGDVKDGDALGHARAELGPLVPVTDRWKLADFRPQWALAVGLRTAPTLRRLTRRQRVRWAALDHCGDNLTFTLEGASRDGWDLSTTLSEDARRFAEGVTYGYFGHDFVPVGYPELDQLHTVVGDRVACRAKWNLPQGQKILLFGPAARPIRLGRVRRWWFQQLRYRRVLRALRRWAEMAGFQIIAKTRAKHRDPAYLRRYCDRVVGDVQYYPFTTLELLRAANLYVGFASAMAIEASAVGLPQVHLHGWPPERGEWPAALPLKQRFFMDQGGLWNAAGSRQVACYGANWPMRIHETLDETLAEFSRAGSGEMRAACERWAGPLDDTASARLLDVLEARC